MKEKKNRKTRKKKRTGSGERIRDAHCDNECQLTIFYLNCRLSGLDVLPIRLFDLLLGRLADGSGLLVPLADPFLLELVGHLFVFGRGVLTTGLETDGLRQTMNVLQTT